MVLKKKREYEVLRRLVGLELCIRERVKVGLGIWLNLCDGEGGYESGVVDGIEGGKYFEGVNEWLIVHMSGRLGECVSVRVCVCVCVRARVFICRCR